MRIVSSKVMSEVRNWIYRYARAIDVSRWQYHFEYGCPEAVSDALAKYQNSDGGFGNALEADCWNPESSPIQTFTATEILREIGFEDPERMIISGILRYLDSGKDFTGQQWRRTILSNNQYPHAPWWQADEESQNRPCDNPTAALAGFGLCFSDPRSQLYALCARIAEEAANRFLNGELLEEMHTVQCFVRLWEYCEISGIHDVIDMKAFREKMREQVNYSITQDTGLWEDRYICRPSLFFTSPRSIFYQDNKPIADYESEFILRTRMEGGVWDLTWKWDEFPEEWALARNWWKGDLAVKNMLYLKRFLRA